MVHVPHVLEDSSARRRVRAQTTMQQRRATPAASTVSGTAPSVSPARASASALRSCSIVVSGSGGVSG
eukprot:2401288-Prymnesium_polylepis.1